MVKKYNEFNDGYSQGMFVMARDFEFIVDYLKEEKDTLSKEQIVEMIERAVNSSLQSHIVNSGYSATEPGYYVFLKDNTIVTDKVKALVQEELMDDK